jgi:hypothetical protein
MFPPAKLTGVEVEGFRLYPTGHSRYDTAAGYIAALSYTCFVVGNSSTSATASTTSSGRLLLDNLTASNHRGNLYFPGRTIRIPIAVFDGAANKPSS